MEKNERNLEIVDFDREKERSEDVETEQTRGTYSLRKANGRTSQDTETMGVREGHSLPGERRPMTSQDTEIMGAREGHSPTGERRPMTSQDRETMGAREGHSPTGERRPMTSHSQARGIGYDMKRKEH